MIFLTKLGNIIVRFNPIIRKPIFLSFKRFFMKLILAIPAAGLLFSGVLGLNNISTTRAALRTTVAVSNQSPGAVEKTPLSTQKAPRMWVNKKQVFKGESLHLHFTRPHGAYLGVIDPQGHFFYVVFPADQSLGKLTPLVSSEQFADLEELAINTAGLKADPYVSGVLENKPVFTQSGTYRFVMGDVLHTDDERFVDIVQVHYRHRARRPAKTAVAYAAND